MKSNHQARHLLGLNYKLSRQKKWCSKATKKLPLTISMLRAANAAVVNFQLSDDKTPSAKRDGVLRQSHASHPSFVTICFILCPLHFLPDRSLIAAPGSEVNIKELVRCNSSIKPLSLYPLRWPGSA